MSEELEQIKELPQKNNVSKSDIFEFIKFPEKLQKLINANEILNINKHVNNKIIFVYSAPKVGSTSIVSSFRIFAIDKIDVIHIYVVIIFNKEINQDIVVIQMHIFTIHLNFI